MALGEDANSQNSGEDDARLKQYKNLGKHEDMRRRRNECSVELRKQKRDNMIMKRRNVVDEDSDEERPEAEQNKGDVRTSCVARVPPMSSAEIVKILSNNPTVEEMRSCFEMIRRILSKSKNPPIEEVISCGLLEALVQALAVSDDKVRFEAAWGLTNIVSGTSEQTLLAVRAGATAPLIELTMSPNMQLSEQALWAVTNIAGDSAQLRDFVIQNHGVEALLHLVAKLDKMEDPFARTIAWAFSNMCRHKNPHATIIVLRELSKGLFQLVQHKDKIVRQDACWAISYLTDGPDEQIQLALDSGVLPYVRAMLQETDSLIAPALRVLGNMATGSDSLTQAVVDLGTLGEIVPLSERSRSTTIIKEACWLISNVIAGTQAQIQAVLDANLLPFVIEVLNSGEFKCQLEASWAVANLAQGGTSEQILNLWSDGAVPSLCQLLKNRNVDILTNTLETLYTLLATVSTIQPDHMEQIRDLIEEASGLDHLERLQESESEKVYNMAYRIISEFFNEEEEEGVHAGDENSQPVYEF